MQRPLSSNPMLQLLCLRAHARAHQGAGIELDADPWLGTGSIASRAVGDGPLRRPATWMDKWPAPARQAFWDATGASLVCQAWDPNSRPDMEVLVHAAHRARKTPVEWGIWPTVVPADGVLFGVRPALHGKASKLEGLPAQVRAVGLEIDPRSLDVSAMASLEHASLQAAETWWVLPAQDKSWDALAQPNYRLAHRLGVSVWLEAPAQCDWSDYMLALAQSASFLGRHGQWDQWIWPVCDLVEQALVQLMESGRSANSGQAPWKWEGRCRNPDWAHARSQVWKALEQALGGPGAIEEILVATVLWHGKLLEPQMGTMRGLA